MRLLGASAVLVLVAASGCDPGKAPPHPGAVPRGAAKAAASAAPSALPSASASSLVVPDSKIPELPLEPKVRRAMKIGPQWVHEPGVAIGSGRIGVLTENALVARDATTLDEVTRVEMHEPRELAVTADGSLLALDPVRTVWLLAHDLKPHKFAPPVLIPGSLVFADRSTPEQFWVLSGGGGKFFEYVLEQKKADDSWALRLPILVANDWVSLDGYDGRLFGSLRDGSFLYSTDSGFRRFFGPAHKEEVEGKVEDAFRLLPGSRVDTIWFVTRGKALLYRLLEEKLVKLSSVSLSSMAYDADADGTYLAVLELLQPSDKPWTMMLEVFDVAGQRHMQQAFTTTESLDPKGWLRALKRNRHLSIRAGETPLVAVGGPDELSVFRADTGARVGPAPPPAGKQAKP